MIKYKDLCSLDFSFGDIAAYRMKSDNIVYDYESTGRTKHLIFYQIENKRKYYLNDEHICTLNQGDVLFLPHGTKYRSFAENIDLQSDGIGVSFDMYSQDGEKIMIDEPIKLVARDSYGQYLKRFKKILFSVNNPAENVLRLKGELYSILDELFAEKEKREDFKANYGDIVSAITLLENHPERNLSAKELADMCHMSESSFLRKFKNYSGGIAPVKYRNNIRLILAEELVNSPMSLNTIAEKLGFYDAAHLCKVYKQAKGYTIKRRK